MSVNGVLSFLVFFIFSLLMLFFVAMCCDAQAKEVKRINMKRVQKIVFEPMEIKTIKQRVNNGQKN